MAELLLRVPFQLTDQHRSGRLMTSMYMKNTRNNKANRSGYAWYSRVSDPHFDEDDRPRMLPRESPADTDDYYIEAPEPVSIPIPPRVRRQLHFFSTRC